MWRKTGKQNFLFRIIYKFLTAILFAFSAGHMGSTPIESLYSYSSILVEHLKMKFVSK